MIIASKMNLREIVTVDGRRAALSMYQEWAKKNKLRFGAADCVLFYNHTRTFLRFVSGLSHDTLVTVELRLAKGAWNPLRLADFAKQAGVELMNLKGFAEHYEEEREREAA